MARLAPFLIQTLKGNDHSGALGRDGEIGASRGSLARPPGASCGPGAIRGPFGSVFNTNLNRN